MVAPKEEVWGMQKSGYHQQHYDDSQGWSNSMDIGPMEGKSSKSRKRYKLYDIEKEIEKYDKGESNISKDLYNTLKIELNNIRKNVGKEI